MSSTVWPPSFCDLAGKPLYIAVEDRQQFEDIRSQLIAAGIITTDDMLTVYEKITKHGEHIGYGICFLYRRSSYSGRPIYNGHGIPPPFFAAEKT